ncbi:hypothetical protein SAMN04488072_11131 [Lentibacillus halodurans]|uniref:Uncharacterized protein n=1 Tax=Lentibacillus halodurans TaxID=237679 RepID=A0A1I0ZGT3_9BACI|nr:hypothetical protein SAMN04488072_11131 [Lentibacillus halodurans]
MVAKQSTFCSSNNKAKNGREQVQVSSYLFTMPAPAHLVVIP